MVLHMLMGIRLKANPTEEQKLILSQWMGCARFVWNAKCEEENYLRSFAKKYLPLGTYPKVDSSYSQYKDKELSPWLFAVPSQVLRNSVANWYSSYQDFLKGKAGKPRRKKKSDSGSVHLTRELFSFKKDSFGNLQLILGTKKYPVGALPLKIHRSFQAPSSIYIKKKNGSYFVSFCYEDCLDESQLKTQALHLEYLKGCPLKELEQSVIGIDRGVKRPVQAGEHFFDLTVEQKRKKSSKESYLKRMQKRLSVRLKGSKRREKTRRKISRAHEKLTNIRKNFCHQASRKIVNLENIKVFILEDLKTKSMTKKPKAKLSKNGGFAQNGAKRKAGLNRSILDTSWHQFETYLNYKAYRAGKALFKVNPYQTSQECANCGHTHPSNRKVQETFLCTGCGHIANADHNAAEVIKKRAIKLILHSGTELSKRGVLLDIGRGATNKTKEAIATFAQSYEASKETA